MASRLLACLLLVSPVALITPTSLSASGLEITPFASYRLGGHFDFVDRAPVGGAVDTRLDQSVNYGLVIDIPIGLPNVKFEILWNHQRSELELDIFSSPTIFNVDVDHFQAGFVYEWERGNLHPYFAGTVGVSQLDPQRPGLTSFTRGSASVGGGTKFMLNPHFGFRLEGRLYGVRTGGDDVFCSPRGCLLESPNPFLWQLEGSAGLIFSF